ncbi:universal stress protein [Parafilimonas terrae]|uniref:Nucleotide-binding universal stress protein, UspA family n=1 Tax=Parafilimonas terrae TaxID=1465490 RepID=A0A1I5TCK7_9BACT|nr:universal stress protein [Parafilimonas terrae]SFP80784.1 Nucleotide-binding universal stress protein, UspA family [Parafilimonas terrae]
MRTIIAPVDFSTVSENASLYAAQLAVNIKADLVLLHIMELPLAVAEYPVTESVFDEAGIEKELETLKTKLLAAVNNKISIRTKNILGSTGHQIKELCKTERPFAVVIATHSSSVLDRFFLGSTTVYSAKHLRYPVIVVPHNAKYQTIKKIALATDLKGVYDVPAEEIESIVRLFNAELEVFHAAKNENVINRNSVDNLLLDHRLLTLSPRFHVVKNKDIMRGITDLAKEYNIDLLIIIPKKHGPFHKSQSKDFIFYTDVPLMAIHENDLVPKS